MSAEREELDGHVADIACLRKWPRAEAAERARCHTRACSLEGHCAESGFGLVDDEGHILLLDAAATPRVIEAVRSSPLERGIRLRATREGDGEQGFETVAVEEILPDADRGPANAGGRP